MKKNTFSSEFLPSLIQMVTAKELTTLEPTPIMILLFVRNIIFLPFFTLKNPLLRSISLYHPVYETIGLKAEVSFFKDFFSYQQVVRLLLLHQVPGAFKILQKLKLMHFSGGRGGGGANEGTSQSVS